MNVIRVRFALTLLALAVVLVLPAVVPPAHAATIAHASRASRVFTGNGSARLGTLRLRRTATLRWRAAGGLQLYDRHGFMVLNSRAHHGRVRLRRGVYRGLRVVTPGHWRIAIRSRR
jgi:hypothetical protein